MPEFRLIDSIHDVAEADWETLWQSASSATHYRYPFIRYAFLAALEDTGCTQKESGWTPRHLLIHEGNQLVGAMPLYLKDHSYGEYVFDWAWADAYRRNGLNYYPKLLCAIPFTPATGPRLALSANSDLSAAELTPLIAAFLSETCLAHHWSGWHCLFHPADEQGLWQAHPVVKNHTEVKTSAPLQRTGCQFHWHNRTADGAAYTDFDHFLESFNSRKRKSVRKERRQVQEAGVILTRLTGDQISDDDWDRFYYFYHTTYLKRSGNTGYLNREFFDAIARNMGDQILMVKAEREIEEGHREFIAGALCFFDEQHLYGRYWGCREDIPGLHFEACYYQGIEFAIERGIHTFDPGAQGEHKIQRGFEPTLTYSQHWLADERFHAAVKDFLRQETPGVEAYRDDCATYLPFKSG